MSRLEQYLEAKKSDLSSEWSKEIEQAKYCVKMFKEIVSNLEKGEVPWAYNNIVEVKKSVDALEVAFKKGK